MFQKTLRGVLLGLMMVLFLTPGIVICAGQEPALANSYQNPEHGFALDYPEGWAEVPPWSPEAIFSLISPDQKVRIEVWAEYKSEETTLDAYIALMKSEYFKPEYEIHILSEGEIMLEDGTPAYEMLYTQELMGTEYKAKSVIAVRKTQCLGVYGMAPPADFDANQRDIDQILASFRLLPLKIIPAPPPPPPKTGFHEDEEHGFSISYPKEWTEMPPRAKEVVLSICAPSYFPGVQVVLMTVEEDKTAAEVGSEFAEQAGEIYTDFEVVSQGEITREDGTSAYEVVYIGAPPGAGVMGMKVVFVVRGTQCFWLQGYSSPEKFAEHEPIIDEVIQSFRLTPTSKAAKGEILVATSQGVSIIGEDGWSVLDESKGLPHNRVNAIAVDKEGRIWLAHGRGLSVLDQGEWDHYLRLEMSKVLGFSIKNIDALACDAQGRVWAGHYQGLYVIENGEWKTYEGSVFGADKYVNIKDIAIDAEERVWVAHSYGVSVFDGNDWINYAVETSDLPSRFTQAITIDHEGKIWVAHNYGVSVFDGNNWINYGYRNKSDVEVKALRQAKDIAVDEQNRIWVVTSTRKVSVFDGSKWQTYTRANSGLIGGRGEVIACDAQGRVWVGTDWELAVFDGNQWLTYTQATSGLAANGIRAITCIGDGPPSLPLPGEAQPGSISGKMICQEEPVAEVEVNICWDVSWPIFVGPTPCKGEVYKALTDSEGQFCIGNIPPGAYKLAIRITEEKKEKWYTGGGIGGVPSTVHITSGEETQLDKLEIKK